MDLDQSYQYCYRFESTNVLSWDDSQRACKAYGNGASLASIHSAEQMNKILAELSKNQITSWIGLFTTQNSGTNSFWVDNSAVDFINWEADNNLHEVKVMKKYFIQKREDYTLYNKLSREIRDIVRMIKDLDPS